MSNPTISPGSSLLLFSIGPVQEFIAAARSTRDLWSGSYLLSTFAAQGMKVVAEHHGEKSIIFPHVEAQPLLGSSTGLSDEQLTAFLTPTLPNRFLAILPADIDAKGLANKIEGEIRDKLKIISSAVLEHVSAYLNKRTEARFKAQVDRLLEVQWQTLEVPNRETVIQLVASLPKDDKFDPGKHLTPNSSDEALWGPLNSIIAWLHDGTKSLRSFDAWSTGSWDSGMDQMKDSLTGKEEAVLTLPQEEQQVADMIKALELSEGGLKPGEAFGAATLIKRFWDTAYLSEEIGIRPDLLRKQHPMPNTHSIAKYDNKTDGGSEGNDESDKYFAIIAMDGDQMGQWISGQKFDQAITMEDHRDFSEILNEFSVNHAAGLVEKSDGRLIYSGGDDVLAMVPAGNALGCAQELRNKFVKLFHKKDAKKYEDMNASAGIAIAHFKSPLQDVVKAAHAAEKRAKKSADEGGLGRGAVAFTIMKRSGEILEWGTKWAEDGKDSAGIHLINSLLEDLKEKKLNARFPHKLEAQLTPYLPESQSILTDKSFADNFADILEKEVSHTLKRNAGGSLGETQMEDFTAYWNSTEGEFSKRLSRFTNLLRTAAWMSRSERPACSDAVGVSPV